MSNICILVASDLYIQRAELETQVKQKVNQIGCGVFFDDYDLFPIHKKNNSFICSFSDDYRFDNCEMLLLPDGCWLNGRKTNLVPFLNRMELLGSIIESILDSCKEVELFVGDNGEHMIDEFQPYDVNILDFACFMNQHFNCDRFSAMHLFLYK